MNDVQQALLVKNAYINAVEPSKTALVTANGHVIIAHADNLKTMFQFTLEQWQEIVDFVSIATWDELRDKPEAEKDWIDWSKVPEDFDWAAVDADGRAFAYNYEPAISNDMLTWTLDTEEDNAGFIGLQKPLGQIDWKKSLRKRPTSK